MKKIYYITCLIVLASVIASGFIIPITSESDYAKSSASSEHYEDGEFIIKALGDRIVVHRGEGEKPYLETNFAVSSLPRDMQVKLRRGIVFENEEEMQKALKEYTS